jgi:hypothetical protein
MGYAGIMVALSAFIVYFCHDFTEKGLTAPHLVKSAVFSGVVSGILQAGLILSLAAFNFLIYEIDDYWKYIMLIAVFVWCVVFINLFLSLIPEKGGDVKIPKIFKILTLYAALPVYLLLILILYVYLGKIIATWSFPSGQVNWFASFASFFYIFFLFVLRRYTDGAKAAKLFCKFGGIMIIPIIITQGVAVFERFDAYGLTSARYASVVLNIIALGFAAASLIKGGAHIEKMLLIAGGAAVLVTLTPLNIIDVPVLEQNARLIRVLKANGMYENGVIIPKMPESETDRIKITSAYNYVNGSGSKKAAVTGDNRSFNEIFGFNASYEGQKPRAEEYGHYRDNGDYIDIAGYSKLYDNIHLYPHNLENRLSGNTFILSAGDEIIEYDFSEEIKRLYEKYGINNDAMSMFYDVSVKYRIYIKSIDFTVYNDDGRIAINNVNLALLEK